MNITPESLAQMSEEQYASLGYEEFHARLDQAANQDPRWKEIQEKLNQETSPIMVPDYLTFVRICHEMLDESGMLSYGSDSWNPKTYTPFTSTADLYLQAYGLKPTPTFNAPQESVHYQINLTTDEFVAAFSQMLKDNDMDAPEEEVWMLGQTLDELDGNLDVWESTADGSIGEFKNETIGMALFLMGGVKEGFTIDEIFTLLAQFGEWSPAEEVQFNQIAFGAGKVLKLATEEGILSVDIPANQNPDWRYSIAGVLGQELENTYYHNRVESYTTLTQLMAAADAVGIPFYQFYQGFLDHAKKTSQELVARKKELAQKWESFPANGSSVLKLQDAEIGLSGKEYNLASVDDGMRKVYDVIGTKDWKQIDAALKNIPVVEVIGNGVSITTAPNFHGSLTDPESFIVVRSKGHAFKFNGQIYETAGLYIFCNGHLDTSFSYGNRQYVYQEGEQTATERIAHNLGFFKPATLMAQADECRVKGDWQGYRKNMMTLATLFRDCNAYKSAHAVYQELINFGDTEAKGAQDDLMGEGVLDPADSTTDFVSREAMIGIGMMVGAGEIGLITQFVGRAGLTYCAKRITADTATKYIIGRFLTSRYTHRAVGSLILGYSIEGSMAAGNYVRRGETGFEGLGDFAKQGFVLSVKMGLASVAGNRVTKGLTNRGVNPLVSGGVSLVAESGTFAASDVALSYVPVLSKCGPIPLNQWDDTFVSSTAFILELRAAKFILNSVTGGAYKRAVKEMDLSLERERARVEYEYKLPEWLSEANDFYQTFLDGLGEPTNIRNTETGEEIDVVVIPESRWSEFTGQAKGIKPSPFNTVIQHGEDYVLTGIPSSGRRFLFVRAGSKADEILSRFTGRKAPSSAKPKPPPVPAIPSTELLPETVSEIVLPANNNDYFYDGIAGEDALLATGTDGRAIPVPFATMMAAGDPPQKPGGGIPTPVPVVPDPNVPGTDSVDTGHARGALSAFASGLKPAVLLSPKIDQAALLRHFEWMQPLPFFVNDVLVNEALVKARVESEPELASFVGWDKGLSAAENIRKASESDQASSEMQTLMGFVLGYPDEAIRGYKRHAELTSRGIPEPADLGTLGHGIGDWFRLDLSGWDPNDREKLEGLARRLDNLNDIVEALPRKNNPTVAFNNLYTAYLAEWGGELARLYEKYFGLSPDDIQFLLSRRGVLLRDHNGDTVYSFMIWDKRGMDSPCVRELAKMLEKIPGTSESSGSERFLNEKNPDPFAERPAVEFLDEGKAGDPPEEPATDFTILVFKIKETGDPTAIRQLVDNLSTADKETVSLMEELLGDIYLGKSYYGKLTLEGVIQNPVWQGLTEDQRTFFLNRWLRQVFTGGQSPESINADHFLFWFRQDRNWGIQDQIIDVYASGSTRLTLGDETIELNPDLFYIRMLDSLIFRLSQRKSQDQLTSPFPENIIKDLLRIAINSENIRLDTIFWCLLQFSPKNLDDATVQKLAQRMMFSDDHGIEKLDAAIRSNLKARVDRERIRCDQTICRLALGRFDGVTSDDIRDALDRIKQMGMEATTEIPTIDPTTGEVVNREGVIVEGLRSDGERIIFGRPSRNDPTGLSMDTKQRAVIQIAHRLLAEGSPENSHLIRLALDVYPPLNRSPLVHEMISKTIINAFEGETPWEGKRVAWEGLNETQRAFLVERWADLALWYENPLADQSYELIKAFWPQRWENVIDGVFHGIRGTVGYTLLHGSQHQELSSHVLIDLVTKYLRIGGGWLQSREFNDSVSQLMERGDADISFFETLLDYDIKPDLRGRISFYLANDSKTPYKDQNVDQNVPGTPEGPHALMATAEGLIASWQGNPANYTLENIRAARDALVRARQGFEAEGNSAGVKAVDAELSKVPFSLEGGAPGDKAGDPLIITYKQVQPIWDEQDKILRGLAPEERLERLESLEPLATLTGPDEQRNYHLDPTPEQFTFWGGEREFNALADAQFNQIAQRRELEPNEIILVNRATARLTMLRIEAEREIYYRDQDITSHLQLEQYSNPTSNVMTYYSVGPKPSNVTALLPEAIEYGTMGMGSSGPNTDVWAIDVPEEIENQVLGGGRGRQKIRDDEGFNPHAYGVRHIGVLRDGQLIFDEGADTVLFGNIEMGKVATTDYTTMWGYVAEHRDLPPSARREMHIPGGTVWKFPTKHVAGTDHHPIYDSYADFSRPYVSDPLPDENTWDMSIVDTIETASPEGTIQWQDMGGLSRALVAMAEIRGDFYFALHLDGTWGVYEDYPPFRYGDRIYQMEYLAGAKRWDITRYDKVEKTINRSGREVPLVLNLWAQREVSFYLLDDGPFLRLNLPRPDSRHFEQEPPSLNAGPVTSEGPGAARNPEEVQQTFVTKLDPVPPILTETFFVIPPSGYVSSSKQGAITDFRNKEESPPVYVATGAGALVKPDQPVMTNDLGGCVGVFLVGPFGTLLVHMMPKGDRGYFGYLEPYTRESVESILEQAGISRTDLAQTRALIVSNATNIDRVAERHRELENISQAFTEVGIASIGTVEVPLLNTTLAYDPNRNVVTAFGRPYHLDNEGMRMRDHDDFEGYEINMAASRQTGIQMIGEANLGDLQSHVITKAEEMNLPGIVLAYRPDESTWPSPHSQMLLLLRQDYASRLARQSYDIPLQFESASVWAESRIFSAEHRDLIILNNHGALIFLVPTEKDKAWLYRHLNDYGETTQEALGETMKQVMTYEEFLALPDATEPGTSRVIHGAARNPAEVRVDMVNPDHFTAYHDRLGADELEALMMRARDQQGTLDYADTPWEFPPEQEAFLERAIPEVLERRVAEARVEGVPVVNLTIKSIGIGDVTDYQGPGELVQVLERIFDAIAGLNVPDIHFNIIVVGFDVNLTDLRKNQRQIEKEARILTGAHHPEGQVSVKVDMYYGDLTDSTSREVMAGYGPSDLTLWRYTWIAADPESFDPELRPAYTTAPLSSEDAYHFIDALRAGTSGALLISDIIGTKNVDVMEVRK